MPSIPAKTVVLTFDDAVKSHRTFVAPLLKELGFGATFFVTHRWMDDKANFMSWSDIAELHQLGFEIGNHTWSHASQTQPRGAARLEAELALVDNELARVKVPKPISFAWPGNGFGPEAFTTLARLGYKLARRGGMPEVEYGRATVGPLYDPTRRHRLLIPTTADSYPNWTIEHFASIVERVPEGQAIVLQFHGVPDTAHPWVHTEPALFRQCMDHLKRGGFRVIAMRDLLPYLEGVPDPADPLLAYRHPLTDPAKLRAPVEVEQTRAALPYWLGVMRRHGYSDSEIESVTGLPKPRWPEPERVDGAILPYPGGRHPRIGFLNGAVGPMRGTKASVFLPWDPSSYVVVDVPEAILAPKMFLFLAHTHIPTMWDDTHTVIDNVDWTRTPGGGLESAWTLPNKAAFGASVKPSAHGADLELWIRNGTPNPIAASRAQVCVMLRGARGFDAQDNANKTLGKTAASVISADRKHRITVEWEPVNRVWANPPCPCMHSDPAFAECAPGDTVRARGRLTFD